MLVFPRKPGQASSVLNSKPTITLQAISANHVSFSFDSPRKISVFRGELPSPQEESTEEDTVVEDDISRDWRPAPKSRARRSGEVSILVAITNDEVRRRYADALRDEGYRIVETGDGLTCLDCLRSARFALLVAEMQLLWGGGDGVVELMNLEESINSIPAVLLHPSGHQQTLCDYSNQLSYATGELVQIIKRHLEEIA